MPSNESETLSSECLPSATKLSRRHFPKKSKNHFQIKPEEKIKRSKPTDMADFINLVFRKKTFFVFLVAFCLCALTAAITASIVMYKGDDPTACLKINSELTCIPEKFYHNHGTKSFYIGGKGNSSVMTDDPSVANKSGCFPTLIYLFSRHAIRYPDKEDIEEMDAVLNDVRDQLLLSVQEDKIKLCDQAVAGLKSWKLKMIPTDDCRISQSGIEQAKELGKRFKMAFPNIFDVQYNTNRYKIGITQKDRTTQTAIAFSAGVFGDGVSITTENSDDILQFHKTCDKIYKKSGGKKIIPHEEAQFSNSSVFEKTLKDLSERLQLNMTQELAKVMLRVCQFEMSINGESVWCYLFSESNIRVFEYKEDLNDYYKDGYGHRKNYEQACPVVSDIVNKMKLAIEGDSSDKSLPSAYLMFSHAGALKKVSSRFGLFKDASDLKADDYCSADKRQWRSSQICPFNANMAFVLYKCQDEAKVKVLYNERPVKVEGCSNLLCSWKEFEKTYEPIADKCELENICKLNKVNN